MAIRLLIIKLSPSAAGDAPVRELTTIGMLNLCVLQTPKTWQFAMRAICRI